MAGSSGMILALVEAVLFGLAYFGCAEISHLLSFPGVPFATLWLPGGLLMAVLARLPSRRWPEVLAAAVLANLASDIYCHDKSLAVSGCSCVANGLEAVIGAILIRQLAAPHLLPATVTGVVHFVLVAAVFATSLGATIGAAVVHLAYGTASYHQVWVVWWAAHALGVLIVCPCVLSWLPPEEGDDRPEWFGWWSEAAPVFALAGVVSALIFLTDSSQAPPLLQFPIWLFPIIVWSGVRLGVCGASTTALVIALAAVLGTSRGWGPFAHIGESLTEHMVLLQVFQGIVAFVALSLAAILAELRAARDDLKAKHNQLLEANRRLESLAETDGLTGVKNRRAFDAILQFELARSRRCAQEMSLLLLDVDAFKEFNDTYGHLAGDELLKELTELIQLTVRQTDIVARYGGEEFAVILPDTGAAGALIIAERLREDIDLHAWPFRSTSVSIGVATCEEGREPPRQLLAAADAALYLAKARGKNRVVHATDAHAAADPAGEAADLTCVLG